jgi:hypothetical protein
MRSQECKELMRLPSADSQFGNCTKCFLMGKVYTEFLHENGRYGKCHAENLDLVKPVLRFLAKQDARLHEQWADAQILASIRQETNEHGIYSALLRHCHWPRADMTSNFVVSAFSQRPSMSAVLFWYKSFFKQWS